MTLTDRIYGDYFMRSRLAEYESIIKMSLEHGYKHVTLVEFVNLCKENKIGGRKYFIHRHDIDSDIETARAFFQIEQKYNINSSFYFRLRTLDYGLMSDIHNSGSEASYHFEEIATFCKKNHIKKRELATESLFRIRSEFKEQFLQIENKLGFKLKTVAAHGDFANRKLKMYNQEILECSALRSELGIEAEAYDEVVMSNIDIYVSDKPPPMYYFPKNVKCYIGSKNIICMLSHPKQWVVNWKDNTVDNIIRVYESLRW